MRNNQGANVNRLLPLGGIRETGEGCATNGQPIIIDTLAGHSVDVYQPHQDASNAVVRKR